MKSHINSKIYINNKFYINKIFTLIKTLADILFLPGYKPGTQEALSSRLPRASGTGYEVL